MMKKLLVPILSIMILAGCSSGGAPSTTPQSSNTYTEGYDAYSQGTVLDKIEGYKGHDYVIEVKTNEGEIVECVASKTDFERAKPGGVAYYQLGNVFTLSNPSVRIPSETTKLLPAEDDEVLE